MQGMVSTIVGTLISTILSTGIVTLVLKFCVESALNDARDKKKNYIKQKEERYQVMDEWRDNIGICIFWINHGIKKLENEEHKGYWNGELQEAIDHLESTRKHQDEIERKQLSELNS